MRFKSPLGLTFFTIGVASILMCTGSYGLFTATAQNLNNSVQSGTVKFDTLQGDDYGCQEDDFSYMKPGDTRSSSFYVHNTGSLDEWIGIKTTLPSDNSLSNNYIVSYAVWLYPTLPTPADEVDKDANGDLHSHCHTGSKGRGAGGNDKSKLSDPPLLTRDGIIKTDISPMTPFKLPVGYYAEIGYSVTIPKDKGSNKQLQSSASSISLNTVSVQVRNNDGPNGPVSWDENAQ